MQIGCMAVDYLGHVCFRFRSPAGRVLVTDPFFAEGFEWGGHFERHLPPPKVRPADITKCAAIFVSHIHGDHFDPEAIRIVHDLTGARVIGPADVLDELSGGWVPGASLDEAEEGKTFVFEDLSLMTHCGYDNSRDRQGRPNKFSLVIAASGTRFFYSGDCHEMPPAVRGQRFEAMFCWPHTSDEKLRALCRAVDSEKFIIMHCDRFEPGEFMCNLDLEEQQERVQRLLPGLEALVPRRAEKLE